MRVHHAVIFLAVVQFLDEIDGWTQIGPGHGCRHQHGAAQHGHLPDIAQLACTRINDGDGFVLAQHAAQNAIQSGHADAVIAITNWQEFDIIRPAQRAHHLKRCSLRVGIKQHNRTPLIARAQIIGEVYGKCTFANTTLDIPDEDCLARLHNQAHPLGHIR